MKRNLMGLLTGFVVATGVALAQSATTSAGAQTQKPEDVTLTGCVTQGAAPTVFILDHAKVNPADEKETGKVYLLAAATPDVNLTRALNHEVSVTGIPDGKTTLPAGQKVPEKNLPRFSAKSVILLADKCQTR